MSTTLEPPVRGLSLEDAITEFKRIQERYAELAEEKKRVMEVLITAATESRQGSKTVRLENHNKSIVLKAEFGEGFRCDVNGLNEAREMLGDDVFEDLFKTEYKPKLRGLRPFLASKSTDERIETAKEKVKEAVTVVPETPRITVEKS